MKLFGDDMGGPKMSVLTRAPEVLDRFSQAESGLFCVPIGVTVHSGKGVCRVPERMRKFEEDEEPPPPPSLESIRLALESCCVTVDRSS